MNSSCWNDWLWVKSNLVKEALNMSSFHDWFHLNIDCFYVTAVDGLIISHYYYPPMHMSIPPYVSLYWLQYFRKPQETISTSWFKVQISGLLWLHVHYIHFCECVIIILGQFLKVSTLSTSPLGWTVSMLNTLSPKWLWPYVPSFYSCKHDISTFTEFR